MIIERIDRSEAYRYMGIRGEVDAAVARLADECEGELLREMSPKFCWVYAEIAERSERKTALEGRSLRLCGNDIATHIEGCFGVVLLCATLGIGADRLLRKYQAEDMTKALICDALASAAVEQVCDYAEKEIAERFPKKFMTTRFSPGYGDFPIGCQGDFLTAANAQKVIGLCVNNGGMLTPSKSVTAVIGLHNKSVEKYKKSCENCGMKDSCNFRKVGGHCNV